MPDAVEAETIDLDDETTPSALIAKAMRDYADGPKGNDHAMMDYKLPAIVRGYLAINQGNASETNCIREAGFMPALYARYEGEPVRVTMVSRLGDVGISHVDEEYGYFSRLSVYDLTDFTLDPSALHAHQLKEAEPCRREQRPLDPLSGEPKPSRWRTPPRSTSSRRSRRRQRGRDESST